MDPLAVCYYYEGGTPREFMEENKLNSQERLRLLVGIAEGVAHIHRNSIVHGDLKGDNIVIEISHEGTIPKVTDFGSSRLACLGCKYKHINQQVGTFQWISPEVRQGDSGWTTRSDIWAAGCVILEVQFNTIPYTRRGEVPCLMNTFRKQRANELPATRGDFEPLLSLDGVAEAVWNVIGYCWELDPDKRPSAEELVICLRQAYSNQDLLRGGIPR
ncbi:hypothetical protein RSOLAG22IIIB_05647 [Rhizoctonia solani]|uniref:Protein kinase domain-containing protein n=1 Tax=Rhizoctonia solani TaxID=456999 RepID=A0A0K6G8G2_9AGAM|nr:hypothetical protein RSOLAG22IIIB_05647 [Rhizoctonia solani]